MVNMKTISLICLMKKQCFIQQVTQYRMLFTSQGHGQEKKMHLI